MKTFIILILIYASSLSIINHSTKLFVEEKWSGRYFLALLSDVMFSILATEFLERSLIDDFWYTLFLYGIPNLLYRIYIYDKVKKLKQANMV